MYLEWRKLANLLGLMILFGFLNLLLGCAGSESSKSATAVPANNKPTLIVFYTDN